MSTHSVKPKIRSFRDLLVWQRSIELAVEVFHLTQMFPREELFGITAQMRRSAVSVGSNISEGQGRLTRGEFRQFLGIARGSNAELQTQLEIAKALEFGDKARIARVETLSLEIGKMINAILTALPKPPLTTT
jgi:four helix bundle protein